MSSVQESTKSETKSSNLIFKIQKTPKGKIFDKGSPFLVTITDKNDLTLPSGKITRKQSKKGDLKNDEGSSNSRSKYSLTKISLLVYNFMKEKKKSTISDTTSHVVNYLNQRYKNANAVVKNIQRRVYDAINVMVAVNLLKKNKAIIETNDSVFDDINEPERSITNKLKEDLSPNTKSVNEVQQDKELLDMEKEIKFKQQKLIEEFIDLFFIKKYCYLNKSVPARSSSQDKIDFPFYIIKGDPDKIKIVQMNNRVIYLSESEIGTLDPMQIKTRLVANDLNEKLCNIQALGGSMAKTEPTEELNESMETINEMNQIESEAKKKGLNVFEKGEQQQNISTEDSIFNYLSGIDLFKETIADNVISHEELVKKKRRRSSSFMKIE